MPRRLRAMFRRKAVKIDPWWALPPDLSIRESLEMKNLTLEQAAEIMGLPYPVFLGVLEGAVPITEEIADLLTRVTLDSKQFWLNSEQFYQEQLDKLGLERPKCPEAEAYFAEASARAPQASAVAGGGG